MTTASRRPRRFRPIHLVLSLLLAWGGVVGVAAPASAAVDVIQGTVTGPGLDPSDVTVYLSQELSSANGLIFTASPARSTGVDASGRFAFAGVPNGDYYLLVTAGQSWVQWINGVTVDGTTDLGSASIVLEPGVPVSGTVRDAATGTSIGGVEVIAAGSSDDYEQWINWDADTFDRPVTPNDGSYEIIVPLDDYYELTAVDPNGSYIPQSWNRQSPLGCGCSTYDPVTISPTGTASPAGPYDFDLVESDDLIVFPVTAYQWDGTTPYENIDVVLEKYVSGTWRLAAHGLTDSTGFVVLFAGGEGDYRLRYNLNGVAQVVTRAVDDCGCGGTTYPYPLDDGGRQTLLSGAMVGDEVNVALTFAKPAVPSGGGGTTTPPRKPRSTTSAFVLPFPSATPSPTPTPKPTPSPSSAPSSTPSASPTPTPDPTPVGDTGFPWWIILIIVICIGIVILIIVLVRRR